MSPRVQCEAHATCPVAGQSAHCRDHEDLGCSERPAACYAADDSGAHRCLPVEEEPVLRVKLVDPVAALYEVNPLRWVDCRKVYLGGRNWLRFNAGRWRLQVSAWREPNKDTP